MFGRMLSFAVLIFVFVATPAVGQEKPEGHAPSVGSSPGSPGRLEFDALSIRPSTRNGGLKGLPFLDAAGSLAPPAGGLFSWSVPLNVLIAFAYDIRQPQVAHDAWASLPKWAQGQWYSIEARAEGTPTRDNVRQMVRSMLEERFQFAGHLEKREGEVLALEVDKPGPWLKPHPEGAPCALPAALTDSKKYPHTYPPYDGFPPRCGVFNRELSHSGERRLEMLNVTMERIASALSGMPRPLGGPALSVVDHTGLGGNYDAVLEFAPAIPPNAESSDDAIGAPQFPTALEKQLGLKLVKQKAQVDVFVIDRIEQPAEN